jgi:septal ring factor EnvC (AmiA/AmiB activator)
MNLERDLEYSERSTKGKKILIAICIIFAVLLIISIIGFVKVTEERDTLIQRLTTIQKERETVQQKIEELEKENQTLKSQVASLTEERDRLSKEIASKKAPLPKKKTSTSKKK